jgi:Uma2 family endonuclease
MAEEFSVEPSKTPEKAVSPVKITYEEFLAWADEDTWAEWVNGEVIIMTPASLRHQQIVTFLATSINFFVDAHQLGVVLTAPFQMKIGRCRWTDGYYSVPVCVPL